MNSNRIKEIQKQTAYPDSVSVHQALLQVWNECGHEKKEMPVCNVNMVDYINLEKQNKALQSQINKLLEKYNPVIGLRNIKELKRKDNR